MMANPSQPHLPATTETLASESRPLLQQDDDPQDRVQQASALGKGRSLHATIALRMAIAIYIITTLAIGGYFVVQRIAEWDWIGPIGTYPITNYTFIDPTPVSSTPIWSVPKPDVTWTVTGYELRRLASLTFVRVSATTTTSR